MYQITYAYSGHSENLFESESKEKAVAEFHDIIKGWKLEAHDQFLELEEFIEPDDVYESVLYHEFNEGNWECED